MSSTKIILTIAIAASLALVSHANPVPKAINWRNVANKFFEIEDVHFDAYPAIMTIAENDNEQVATSIYEKLFDHFEHTLGIFERVNELVRHEALTESAAKGVAVTLKENLDSLQGSLQQELARLSDSASQQIRDILEGGAVTVERLGGELVVLLQQ